MQNAQTAQQNEQAGHEPLQDHDTKRSSNPIYGHWWAIRNYWEKQVELQLLKWAILARQWVASNVALMARCIFPRPMQEYPVKPGHAAKIDFKMIFEAAFGSYEEDDGWLKTSYGSMPKIWAKQEGKKQVVVDTETDKTIAVRMAEGDEEAGQIAVDTQRTWNEFLEGVTGYNAKMRSKKAQEQAKKEAKAQAERELAGTA